ncbi:MAG: LD-carboxypeptidase [Chlorobi bacterium]|nr:LD-carboxypeptidase [Chlorobiota bacterium]
MMNKKNRRHFLSTLVGGAVVAPGLLRAQRVHDLPPKSSDSDSTDTYLSRPDLTVSGDSIQTRRGRERRDETLLKPLALKEGSTIGIVAPASGVNRGDITSAVVSLQRLGFNVKTGKHLTRGFGYLAAKDEVRAEEFMKFVCDPEIDCVMAVRGGYGVMRILPMLDFDVIRANPKVIIGYSDITALVNAVYQKSRLIAFHGPVATSEFDAYSVDSFRRTLMETEPPGKFAESDEYSGSRFSEAKASTIVSGKATGRLVGGNLSLVSDVMGTPYEIDLQGKILFLEEIAEEPYRVDRMLTQLALSGQLAQCAGVAFGRFRKCEAPRGGGEFTVSLSLEQVIRRALEPLEIPTLYGLSIGHISKKLTVPIGGLATLDADEKTLSLDEAVVV